MFTKWTKMEKVNSMHNLRIVIRNSNDGCNVCVSVIFKFKMKKKSITKWYD